MTDKRKDEMQSDRVERIRKLRSITGLNLHDTMRLDERILQEKIYTRADLSPPVPDDVADTAFDYILEGRSLSGFDLDNIKIVRAAIRAASTPSAEVRSVSEVTVEEIMREDNEHVPLEGWRGFDLSDANWNLRIALKAIAKKYPQGIKIKAGVD